ncbi:hypothetical protein GWI33_005870 [Rhynchophorus ferrugineus]|uniref:Uncharacterized protein n=1 Tax=Rhynchophorus ferrugineus TaxID=354439 RepID=A0A834IJQ4_RHYFE|nr:hypothetical protein GWI33_005870 [Rhynchophorus ferrugineus]
MNVLREYHCQLSTLTPYMIHPGSRLRPLYSFTTSPQVKSPQTWNKCKLAIGHRLLPTKLFPSFPENVERPEREPDRSNDREGDR